MKNLDAQTNTEELRDLFSPHGELGRVLLPPRGVTAIIEFLEPSEAKTAFRKLAYSKFRHMPLYLEWAPVNVFRSAADVKAAGSNKKQETAGILSNSSFFVYLLISLSIINLIIFLLEMINHTFILLY